MVAKLVLGLVVLAIVFSVAVIAAYRYFDRQAERNHEKEMERMERDEKLFEGLNDDPIDRELEREKGK